MSKVWRRGRNAGAECVPVWKDQEGEGRKAKRGVGEKGRNEVGQLGYKKWVRMEESDRVDDEGRPILERVDLMEAFFAGVHRQIYRWIMYLEACRPFEAGRDCVCI